MYVCPPFANIKKIRHFAGPRARRRRSSRSRHSRDPPHCGSGHRKDAHPGRETRPNIRCRAPTTYWLERRQPVGGGGGGGGGGEGEGGCRSGRSAVGWTARFWGRGDRAVGRVGRRPIRWPRSSPGECFSALLYKPGVCVFSVVGTAVRWSSSWYAANRMLQI